MTPLDMDPELIAMTEMAKQINDERDQEIRDYLRIAFDKRVAEGIVLVEHYEQFEECVFAVLENRPAKRLQKGRD